MLKNITSKLFGPLYLIGSVLGVDVCISSCKKFVQIEPSPTITVTANVFDKNTTATAAQLAIYAQMQSSLSNINWTTALSSDELKNYSTSNSTAMNLYANQLNAVNDANRIAIWGPAYNFIYQSNVIINALSNSPGVTTSAKKQLTGESKFIRAFWNFYLVNLYGDIPLVLSTDYMVNNNLTRMPKSQVYQQIINDLVDAEEMLNSGYVDASDTTVYPIASAERVRPTRWAAEALLARVYLYRGSFGDNTAWTKAEASSTDIINNKAMFDTVPLNSVFLKNSKEAIWQLMVSSSTKYTNDGAIFILTANPATNAGTFTSTISTQLLTTFESGDQRKIKWIADTTFSAVKYYFPYKYKANATTAALLNTEYIMMLRLAEQYLVRAEARVMQNNLSSAVADLNVIRHRAGLLDYSGAMDQSSIKSAILHERQVELFTEAQRWLDLKRTSNIDNVMNVVSSQKGSSWQSYQQLYPIPVADLQNSADRITQNPNY